MDVPSFDKLSLDQKACLRLLFANLSIKEIGRELDVSPNTVKGRLKSARRLVGANTSMKAAIMLVQYERDTLGIDPPRSIGIERQLTDEDPASAYERSEALARNRYPFGYLARIGLIVAIALGAVSLAGALLVGSEAITQIFRAERIDLSDYPYRQ